MPLRTITPLQRRFYTDISGLPELCRNVTTLEAELQKRRYTELSTVSDTWCPPVSSQNQDSSRILLWRTCVSAKAL
jgi:hypothetical protein